jgi:hypothetical protein
MESKAWATGRIHFFELRFAHKVKADGMSRAGIGFESRNMIEKIVCVLLGISLRAFRALLFVHPRNEADRALGMNSELFQ